MQYFKKFFNQIFNQSTHYIFASFALILLLPTIVSAHVKWFVDSEQVMSTKHGLTPFYYLTSVEVIVWAIISVCIVMLFSIFDRIIPEPVPLLRYAEKRSRGIIYIAQAILGLYLITVSLVWKVVLIPEFPITDQYTVILAGIQVLAGLMLIFNKKARWATVLVGLVYVCMGISVGIMALAENAMLLALAIFFFIKHSPHNSKWKYLNKCSVEIVRIGTGVTLIVLAFTEKLMFPELGLAFLDIHQWNFMQNMGLTWFTNNLFVLSTGFAELIFGVIFILGYLTRINTLAIASFFAVSVVTMFIQFGAWEVEDLVVYSAAVIFLFYGHGHTKFFHVLPPHHWLRRRLV
jgi:hypothetical protein